MGTLSSLGRVHNANLVIDAGCGPGIQSKILTSMMKSDGVLYAFDFSPNMLECFGEVFSQYDDFNSNKNNTCEKINIQDKSNIILIYKTTYNLFK